MGDPEHELHKHEVFGVLMQYPGSSGEIRDISVVIKQTHQQSAIATVAADILSLVLLESPGELDADIVLGNSQRFGVAMGYGGPHARVFCYAGEVCPFHAGQGDWRFSG